MSYGLVFLGLPPHYERLKDVDPGLPIGGAQVAEHAMLQSLLRYSVAEPFIVVPNPTLARREARALLSAYDNHERALLAFPEELAIPDGVRVVVFQAITRLAEGAVFRRRWGEHGWPLVGLSHALNGADALQTAMLSTVRPDLFGASDTLICTSRGAVEAWRRLRARVSDSIAGDPSCPAGPKVPEERRGVEPFLIPLGVELGELSPVDPVAARRSLGIPDGATVFLCFGRLASRSKMDPNTPLLSFLKAFDRHPSRVLVIAGDSTGGEADRLNARVRALGLEHRVLLVENPSRRTKGLLHSAADVFLQLGDNSQETFGLAVIEAMAYGLPVIASDWSGYRDTVVDGVTGRLIPTSWRSDGYLGDTAGFVPEWDLGGALATEVAVDFELLTTALRDMADDPPQRRGMGEEGRQRARRKYAWPVIVPRIDALLGGLASPGTTVQSRRAPCWPPKTDEVFGHYATASPGLSGQLRCTDDTALLDAVRRIVPEVVDDTGMAPGAVRSVESLMETMASRGLRRYEARQLLLRGIKYGTLAPVPPSTGHI
ncbi:hypothetical protein GCM10023347_40550 [Streptomyces chumphonensis]|uniref:D-inositol 3-phosphate glycosyltransferase n=1 Tax=Streptomyces chumphonensis TaxID=1214925 RepID=A0A927EV63_9ACTN|nr:glycosyltransferase family 4 protein [Streptomyces chumphonensis]MBD3930429.1 glycosyltransferase family 4 protein [Streptomyces chumphonensis]